MKQTAYGGSVTGHSDIEELEQFCMKRHSNISFYNGMSI